MPYRRVGAALRRQVIERASHRCEYCLSQRPFSPDPFSIEHIIPRSRRGRTRSENLALACQGCNGHKLTAVEAPDPVSLELVPLFHPRADRWRDHFRWSSDFQQIIGTSATGRATVERLQLNRPEVINLRRVLIALGNHPPTTEA